MSIRNRIGPTGYNGQQLKPLSSTDLSSTGNSNVQHSSTGLNSKKVPRIRNISNKSVTNALRALSHHKGNTKEHRDVSNAMFKHFRDGGDTTDLDNKVKILVSLING